jgi:putative tricarboxylic transport membrane protein
MTVQAAKAEDRDSFGKGNIKGVIAPEAAINAKDCSALIPTLAFGIPGGVEMAVFMGILIVHGMQPGPLMLVDHQVEIYGLIWALTASCVLASFVGLLLVRPLSQVTLLDAQILVPIVLCVAFAGSYAIDMTIENVVLTAIFGIIGYLMIRFDYPRLTIVIALVLGASAERNFHQSMLMSDGKWSIYVNRPICLLLLTATIALLIVPLVRGVLQQAATRKVLVQRESV